MEGSRQEGRFTQCENSLLPAQFDFNRRRLSFEAMLVGELGRTPSANTQLRSAGLLGRTQSILIGTGTQRGVAAGLSQGRNLRSKI